MTATCAASVDQIVAALGPDPVRNHGWRNDPRNLREIEQILIRSPHVDRASARLKLEEAAAGKADVPRLVDRIAEFHAAARLAAMLANPRWAGARLSFGERPDLRISLPGVAWELGVEVKHARLRAKDHSDREALQGWRNNGLLVEYGSPLKIQLYLENTMFAKAEQSMHVWTNPWVLFVLSDSDNQVEDIEVRAARYARYIRDGHRPPGLRGIAFSGQGRSAQFPALYPLTDALLADDVGEFLRTLFIVEPRNP